MKTHLISLASPSFVAAVLAMSLIAAEKPVEGPIDAFRGDAKFDIQPIFEAGRLPNVPVNEALTRHDYTFTPDPYQWTRKSDGKVIEGGSCRIDN